MGKRRTSFFRHRHHHHLHWIPAYLSDSPKIPEIITRSSNQRDCSSPKAARSKLPSKGNVLSKADTNEAEYIFNLITGYSFNMCL